MKTFLEPNTDAYTGRYLTRLERDEGPTIERIRRSIGLLTGHRMPLHALLLLHLAPPVLQVLPMICRSEVPEAPTTPSAVSKLALSSTDSAHLRTP